MNVQKCSVPPLGSNSSSASARRQRGAPYCEDLFGMLRMQLVTDNNTIQIYTLNIRHVPKIHLFVWNKIIVLQCMSHSEVLAVTISYILDLKQDQFELDTEETVAIYCGAYFDCTDACMERYDENRINIEKLLNQGIRRVVMPDENDWRARHVEIDVWRAFFSRFRMEEKDLSMSSLYQVDLMVQYFPCVRSCTLDLNGKSLIVGRMGTPICSLSVWKFL
ncbi:uncharacterized protein LOC120001993 [Tripterygium wilfordii]|uniref:uncharacterized protein LOC120001993 n=1 Tax=Tripterygium wilfordii TaxID=458696 RepID=UPI0018F82068|nr:uncharacterized protein LOC120001993 [Tripterygium wilfordii]